MVNKAENGRPKVVVMPSHEGIEKIDPDRRNSLVKELFTAQVHEVVRPTDSILGYKMIMSVNDRLEDTDKNVGARASFASVYGEGLTYGDTAKLPEIDLTTERVRSLITFQRRKLKAIIQRIYEKNTIPYSVEHVKMITPEMVEEYFNNS